MAVRRLIDNDNLWVINQMGKWYAVEGFEADTECVCTAP